MYIGLKLSMKGTSIHIKNIMELNSSVVVRFEILIWLSRCEIFSGPSRNGYAIPIPMDMHFAQLCSIEESFKSFKSWPYLTSHVNTCRIEKPLKLKGYIDLKIEISANR